MGEIVYEEGEGIVAFGKDTNYEDLINNQNNFEMQGVGGLEDIYADESRTNNAEKLNNVAQDSELINNKTTEKIAARGNNNPKKCYNYSWKYFFDLGDEKVMTLNQETGKKELQKPTQKQVYDMDNSVNINTEKMLFAYASRLQPEESKGIFVCSKTPNTLCGFSQEFLTH